MRQKYLINQLVFRQNDSGRYNASGKAREDVTRTLKDLGCFVVDIEYREYGLKCFNYLRYFTSILLLVIRLKSHSIVYIQYPHFTYKALGILVRLLKMKDVSVCFIVHDLESLRERGKLELYEVGLLNLASAIVVHTPAMEECLKTENVTPPMSILFLFDYYTDGCERETISYTEKAAVVFAGDLSKSSFLNQLPKLNLPNITFNLYGIKSKNVIEADNIRYVGRFVPEHIADIHGDWGLVWDGTELTGCIGYLGEYLKINSSHKLSLYIASGIPVIVSSTSSLANFITINKLGIIVPSLLNLGDRLREVDEAYMNLIRSSVREFSRKLRNGEMLKSALVKLDDDLQR